MPNGSIRRLVRDRGFGFIKAADGKELFSHCSEVQDVAFDLLKEGQSVEFEIQEDTKGLKAVKVKLIKKGG